MSNRQPYVIIFINGKRELWPYPEAQEFTIYEIPKSSLLFLTFEEFIIIDKTLNHIQDSV